jgi:DNA-directed RNA polymerase subunit RPC12/RpoP
MVDAQQRVKRPPDIPTPGHEVWVITCRGCKRETERPGTVDLVGKQDRLRCKECGHRGADLIRLWRRL